MKRLFVIILISVSVNVVNGQTKADSNKVMFTDSTCISLKDISASIEKIKDEVSVRQYEQFLAVLQRVVAITQKDWEEKQNKK